MAVIFLSLACNSWAGGKKEKEPRERITVFEPVHSDKKEYRLNLEETSQLALKNNFDIQLARYELWIAQTGQDVSESIYDTIFDAEIKYQDDQKAKSSTIFGSTVETGYNVGLSKKLPSGTTLRLDMTNNRHKTTSSFATSPLLYESTLSVTLEQELGKNFFGLKDRGEVKITQLDIENAKFTSLDKIEDHLAGVQKVYWNLVLAQEHQQIQESMVKQAKRLFDLHQEKLESGLVETPDVLASEANYKRRQSELLLTINRVESEMNALKLLLNVTDSDVIVTPSQYLDLPILTINKHEALKQAFDYRRDYKRTLNEIKNKDIQLSMKKNNLWPEINLTASFAKNGLGDDFGSSAENISAESNPDVFAGIEISFPLGNRKARAMHKASELEKAQSLIQLKQLEKQITVAIMDQVRNCQTFKKVALHNEQISSLQAQKLQEEEKRFNQGRSDTDTLIRFQEDVIQDKLKAAEAKHRYLLSLIDLQQKTDTLLDRYWKDDM